MNAFDIFATLKMFTVFNKQFLARAIRTFV